MANTIINDTTASVLKEARIPVSVIEQLKVTKGLRDIVRYGKTDKLMEIKGIAEKRAMVIMNVLQEAKKNVVIRASWKAESREKATGFSVNHFDSIVLYADVLDQIETLNEYKPQEGEDPEILPSMRQKLAELKSQLIVPSPFVVNASDARSIRLTEADIPNVLGVDYESKRPTMKVVALSHEVQKMLSFHWKLFGATKKEGEEKRDEFQKEIMFRLIYRGLKIINGNNSVLYAAVGSSAGHQKKEVVVMAEARAMKAAEKFFWFGRTMEDFIQNAKLTGAEFWKMRANLLRPHLKPFKTAEGKICKIKDVLVVKDVEKIFKFPNARTIGQNNGSLVTDGLSETSAVLGDGAVLFIQPMETQGQLTAPGMKGFGCDASSSLKAMCEKHGLRVEDVLDMEIKSIDGKMHRIGDYVAICGEGCWKFDKAFNSYEAYLDWLEGMSKSYPGIDNLSLLRQSEEIEDEDNVRRLTRTLIQQWMYMTPEEIRKLTARARSGLRKGKTFYGAVQRLAGLFKNEEERSEIERLFAEAPWLVANPSVQEYLGEGWKKRQIEAASGKFRTEGQYPYIMQDLIALLEVWVLGMNPDDENLGVLRGDEVSAADVPDGRELLCVRFPANYLTAKVMVNKACKEAFATLNGVMVLSVHSDILIRQDGDVDGDEMAVIYDRLAIKLTKRVIAEFNPPVILFKHGAKAERHTHATKAEFLRDASDALWRAKRYDSVGLYANLATKCAYLAAMAHKNGKESARDNYLSWMSAASTGAIMAIDQVKGNQVDESLISWLEDIGRKVNIHMQEVAKHMGVAPLAAKGMKHPFVHFYNAQQKGKPVPLAECLPENKDNFVDEMAEFILRDTGSWSDFNFQGVVWNAADANEALTDHSVPMMAVKTGIVSKDMLALLKDNWFKPKNSDDSANETLAKMTVGSKIGLKELLLALWRNEASASYRMDGRTLWEKKQEYAAVCRDILNLLISGGEWVNVYSDERPVGYVFTEDEKRTILANYVIRDSLELIRGNGLKQNKGSYAMFCLKLFAREARENLAKNNRTNTALCANIDMTDIYANATEDNLEDDLELFQVVSQIEDEYVPTDEELEKIAKEIEVYEM